MTKKEKIMATKFDCVFPFGTKEKAKAFTNYLNDNKIRTRQLGYAAIVMPVSPNDEELAIIMDGAKTFGSTRK